MISNNNGSVCIIILNWNSYEVIRECIISIMNSRSVNYRIIVVDNGSKDDSLSKLRRDFPEIDFIESSINSGFAGGNNLGIRFAIRNYSPDYFLLLNNDTIVHEDFLGKMLKRAFGDKNIGCVVPKIYFFDKTDYLYYAGGKIGCLSGLGKHYGRKKKDSENYNKTKEVSFANGCCMLLSCSILSAVGGFDEDYFAVQEDVDLSLRIRKKGFKIIYEPEAKIWHKLSYSSNNNKGSWFVYYLGARNLILFQKKHKKGFFFIISVLYVTFRWTLYNIIKNMVLGNYLISKKIIMGYADGLKNRLRFIE